VTYRDSVLEGERGLSLLGAVGGGGYIHDVLFDNITNPRGIAFGNYAGTTDWEAAPGNRYLLKVWNVEFRNIKDNGHCGNCAAMANGSVCPNVTFTDGTLCGPNPPPLTACPNHAHTGAFISWVREANVSNVYGQIPRPFNRSSTGLPFLGLFDTASGCQAACEVLSNCAQFSWSLDIPEFERHCYGRCDGAWVLHAVPAQYTVVAARRVRPDVPVADVIAVSNSSASSSISTAASSSQASDEAVPVPVPVMRYGCKRNATDQFGSVVRFPWPVCIPLDAPVNVNRTWPNWGPVEGEFWSLQACKDSGCE
jgi:hypothetical protein